VEEIQKLINDREQCQTCSATVAPIQCQVSSNANFSLCYAYVLLKGSKTGGVLSKPHKNILIVKKIDPEEFICRLERNQQGQI